MVLCEWIIKKFIKIILYKPFIIILERISLLPVNSGNSFVKTLANITGRLAGLLVILIVVIPYF